uniref:Uncharacterized protein n=1 Tax=mine drainage metagenome TaxID=410659 RepID=E6PM53_9ZZZZ
MGRPGVDLSVPPDLPLRVMPPRWDEKTWGGPAFSHEHPKPLAAPGVREETIFGLQGERQCRDDRQVIGASLRRCRTP